MNIKLKIKITLKKALLLLFVISVVSACGGAGGGGGGGSDPVPADGGFTVYTIDNTTDTGWYSSIATGSVHISYYDYTGGDLKYISNTAGSWSSPITIANIGTWLWDTTITSITLDDSDNIHVAYFDYSEDRLKYVTCLSTDDCTDSVNWSAPVTVDSATDGGTDVSMTADSSGDLHISYYDITNDSLRYATCSSGCTNQINWSSITVDGTGDTGQYSSISVDSGNIHISYYNYTDSALKYATCPSASDCKQAGNWDKGTVDSGTDVGINSSIAVDSGIVHISYYDFTNGNLKYATCSSNCNQQGNWAVSVIDTPGDSGEYSSIALDTGNKVHISYYDATNENLKYATNVSGSWGTYTADSSASVGEFSSISIDTGDSIHISYYDATNSALKYAVK